jgi:transcription elongation factor B subunit 1
MSKEPSEFVTLVSSDDFEFIIRRESANVAGTLKRMLDPNSKLRMNSHLHA